MKLKSALLVAGLIGGLALAGLALGWFARPYAFHGSWVEQSIAAPDFTLQDQTGQLFQLSAQSGRVVVMYFGYTQCPDECPATMARYRQIQTELGAEAERVRFVLVTADPDVDTPAVLGAYLAPFGSGLLGLTGQPAALESVWQAYGVYVEKHAAGEVDHTNRIYVIDPAGNLRLTYTLETPAVDLAADIRELLRRG